MIQSIGYITGEMNQGNGLGPNGSPPVNAQTGTPEQGVKDRVSISEQGRSSGGGPKNADQLTPEEKQQVNDLKKRDAEVKAHEQAHMAAGGGLVQGGASYQYEVGPDGKRYAVGGEVQIDASPERTPEATIRKMQQVKAAAMAPAQPSSTDRAVAARAGQTEAKARTEKVRQEQEALKEEDETQEDQRAQETQTAPGAEKPDEGTPVSNDTSQPAAAASARPHQPRPPAPSQPSEALIGSIVNMMA